MSHEALTALGLTPHFSAQLSLEELERGELARVVEVQRSGITLAGTEGERTLALGGNWQRRPLEERPTVGDWVLLDAEDGTLARVLERRSVFRRVAAGPGAELQPIAANVDTLLVVSACNRELKESRLERYLALAREAGIDPLIVLTKVDLTEDAEVYRERVRRVAAEVPVELVDAREATDLARVTAWTSPGTTLALVGSSGVGKSTIVNTLSGTALAATGAAREQDARGRHTTSSRALHRLPDGTLLLDVPGMRELGVARLDGALDGVFTDVADLAVRCRFADCAHESEPDCAVREAIAAGRLEARRLESYRKLAREDARHTMSIAERHDRERQFGKLIKEIKRIKDST